LQIENGGRRHIENRNLAISQRVIIGLTRNFIG